MICVSCAGKLEPNMRHAMLSNLCPFCGKNIFTAAEADFRKSIYRILLKNGIEEDGLIARLVDDITNTLRKDIAPTVRDESRQTTTPRLAQPEAQAAEIVAEEAEVVLDDDDESDLPREARNAPSRVLTPDPNRSRPAAPGATTSSKVDQAMKAFEALQQEASDEGQEEQSQTDQGGDELEKQFLRSAGIDPEAVLPKPVQVGLQKPGAFKNTPVRRAQ